MKRFISFFLALAMIITMTDIRESITKASVSLTGEQIANCFLSKEGIYGYNNLCLGFVADVFNELGAGRYGACCAYTYGKNRIISTSKDDIPLGADVFFSGTARNYPPVYCSCGNIAGHIGVYVGDGYMIHSYGGRIQKTKVDTVISHGYTYMGWGIHDNVEIIDYNPEPKTPDIQISNAKYPPEGYDHPVGMNYGISGIVTSNNNITRIWGGVYNRAAMLTSKTDVFIDYNPNSTRVDLSGYVDNNLIFEKIPRGIYKFKIEAQDSTGYTKTLIDSNFTAGIGNPPSPTPNSSMQMTQNSIPKGNIAYNTPYYLKDKITSSLPITHVWGGVYSTDWSPVQKADAYPNSYEYSLSTYFDYQIIFNKLQPGSYHYLIKATDSSGKEYELANSDFNIVSTTQPFSFIASTDSLSFNGFQTKQVTFSYANYSGKTTISWEHGGNSATSLYWNDWNNNSIVLNISSTATGNETITVYLKNTDTGEILGKKTINVSVTGIETKLIASSTSVSINMDKNESKDVVFSYANVPAATNRMNVRYIHADREATKLSWGSWIDHKRSLTITGYRLGKEDIVVEFYDSETDNVLAKQTITVTVTGTTELTLSDSEIVLDLDKNETKTVYMTHKKSPAEKWVIDYVHSENKITTYQWGDWDNGTLPINITGIKPGKEIVSISMLDKATEKVIVSQKLNVTVNASYKVSLDANGGNWKTGDYPSHGTVKYGSNYSFLNNSLTIPEKDGSVFAGWYTDKTAGSKITSSSILNIASDHTLYAHWINSKCKVDYVVGDNVYKSNMVSYNEPYGVLPVVVVKGSEFLGWYTEPNGGTVVTAETIVTLKDDHTLYAHFEKIPVDLDEKFELSIDEITLYPGNKYYLNFKQFGITYTSNNSEVASVSEDGTIEALSKGEAIISIINHEYDVIQLKINVIENVEGQCTIDVNYDGITNSQDIKSLEDYFFNKPVSTDVNILSDVNNDGVVNIIDLILTKNAVVEPKLVPEVRLSLDSVELFPGENTVCDASLYLGDEMVPLEAEWISSDNAIATVNNGTIEALQEGKVIITAIYNYDNNQYRNDLIVNVLATPYLTFLYTTDIFEAGIDYKLVYDVFPRDAKITWTTDEPERAYVSDDGILHTSEDLDTMVSVKGTFTVNGKEYIGSTYFFVLSNCYTLQEECCIEKGETTKLPIKGWASNPENFEGLLVSQAKWTSSDENIVTVDDNGNVYGVSNGIAVITLDIYHNGKNFIRECTVTVK